ERVNLTGVFALHVINSIKRSPQLDGCEPQAQTHTCSLGGQVIAFEDENPLHGGHLRWSVALDKVSVQLTSGLCRLSAQGARAPALPRFARIGSPVDGSRIFIAQVFFGPSTDLDKHARGSIVELMPV